MYGVATSIGIDMSPIEGLVFGSFIAAVDPVAVLTVFEEVRVSVSACACMCLCVCVSE